MAAVKDLSYFFFFTAAFSLFCCSLNFTIFCNQLYRHGFCRAETEQNLLHFYRQQFPFLNASMPPCSRVKSQYDFLYPAKKNKYAMVFVSRHLVADHFLRFRRCFNNGCPNLVQQVLGCFRKTGNVFVNLIDFSNRRFSSYFVLFE